MDETRSHDPDTNTATVGGEGCDVDRPIDLQQLQRQDADAFADLVARHQNVVLGLAQSLGLRGADLDDAAAESFAAIYRALPRFQARSELGTWVYRIAYRVILKARAKRKRGAMAELVTEPAAEQSRVGEKMERTEMAEALWVAVEKLEPRQAAVIELFYRREFPLEKIAETLKCPVGTVKTLLFRGRQRLKEILDRQKVHP